MSEPILIAPSILSADASRFGDEIRAVEQAGADWIHVDVMDGHFVPNLTFGPPVIAALRKHTALPFDVHLMIEAPERSIEQYVRAGATFLTVHAEASVHLHRTLEHIRALGARPGVSLNPATPVAAIHHVLHMVDLVLVMSVNPGFSGQKFIPEVLDKVRDIRARARPDLHVEIDGGIAADTIGAAARAGVDVFVSGSTVFGAADYGATIRQLRQAARS